MSAASDSGSAPRGGSRGARGRRKDGPRDGRTSSAAARKRPPPSSEPVEDVRNVIELTPEVIKELRSTARPGKGDVLAKVFERAASAFLDEDYDEAIRLGEQAKHLALRASSVREFLGLALYRAGRWKEAARELAAFHRLSGSVSQNPVHADCLRALGRPERAIELCDEVARLAVPEPVYYEAQIVAAGALADSGRLDDAIERVERLPLKPEVAEEHHLRAWYVLADLLARRGRFTQANEWFAAVAAADPDLTDAPDRLTRLRGKD